MSQLVKKRKHRKKHTGLTIREERNLKKQFIFGQTEIAEILGVDRSTVARWCRDNLPHQRGTVGKEHRIELRTALHWNIGHKWATDKNLELSALEKILWALSHGFIGGKENPSFSQWRSRMLDEFDWFSVSRDQISFAIGRLCGLGCLPFRQCRW